MWIIMTKGDISAFSDIRQSRLLLLKEVPVPMGRDVAFWFVLYMLMYLEPLLVKKNPVRLLKRTYFGEAK